MCNKNEAISILSEVYNLCNPIFNNMIKQAFLYGSYARGDYHPESDVDILLAVDIPAEEISKYRNSVATITSDLSLKHDVTVSVTVKPLEQFLKFSDVLPYYKNVLEEGVRYAG
ncbi:MAG: nucleotidyltransferase domain-containing protein [Ruminococcaceae bacterium]|nr:nucleotidyltransferase domain-containing protein [Oscillospiraceae bacterium]